MDFLSTVNGSYCENFFPKGWDLDKMEACCNEANKVSERQDFWNEKFTPIECKDLTEFDVKMGHEIANEIKKANENNHTNRLACLCRSYRRN